jgi:uncharacterized protein involved in outer membrane biogenesis
MRKLAIAILAVIGILLVVVLALPHLINVNQHRAQIQSELQKRLGRPVQLGEMSLHTFPLRVEVQNASIADDPNFNNQAPFAQASQIGLSVKLLPLLSKSIEINSLEMQRPKIELIRNAAGVWNFSTLGAAPSAPSPAQQAESKSGELSLSEFKIADGQIAVTDYQKHQPRAVYDHIDLELKNFAPGRQSSINAAAHLPGSRAQLLRLTVEGGPMVNWDMLNMPFKGAVKFDHVSLSGAQKFLNSTALEGTDVVISGSTNISKAGGKISAAGSLKLDDAVIRGVQAGYPISADFDLTDDLTSDVIQIKKGDLKLGSTPLAVNGTLNTRPNPSVVDTNFSATNVSIKEVARLAAAFGVVFSPNAKITGQLTANVHAQGPTDQLALKGNVSGRNLEMTGKDIPQPVRVPTLELTLTPSQIESNNFTATSGATTLNGQMTLAQYTTNSPTVDATIKTVNAKLDELLNIAKGYGISAVEGMTGSGNISLDIHARGPIKNTDAMNFSGNGALQNASLKMPSFTQPLNVRNVNMQFSQNSINLTNLAASLGFTNASGNLSITNFQAPRLTFSLNADKLNVVELEQITGGSSPAPARKSGNASWSLVPKANAKPAPATQPSLLEKATGTGTIRVGSILYQQTELSNVHSNVTLNQGVIQLNPLTSQLCGGQVNGSITVDTRPNPISYAVNLKLSGVDANKFLSSTSSVKDTLYGTLAANTNVTFATPASGDITQTLNGTFSLNLANGKITKLDLLNELSKIGKFGGVGAKGVTNISQMSGTFNLHNGVAQTNDLKAALDVGSLAGTGTISLVNQDLNMHVTAVLNNGFSQSVGGTRVGGYLDTALANNNGELVLPVIIAGNMSHPVVTPDVQQVAQMKLKNLLPTAGGLLGGKGSNNVGGIVRGLLGGGQQQSQTGEPAQQKNPQNNPLGNALDQLLRGKGKH